MFELLQVKNLILHHHINIYLVDDILLCDRMSEKEKQEDFATLLIRWYLKQKRVTKVDIPRDKGEGNERKEI